MSWIEDEITRSNNKGIVDAMKDRTGAMKRVTIKSCMACLLVAILKCNNTLPEQLRLACVQDIFGITYLLDTRRPTVCYITCESEYIIVAKYGSFYYDADTRRYVYQYRNSHNKLFNVGSYAKDVDKLAALIVRALVTNDFTILHASS
ncbi:MAG TPA: hypothetical protein VI911_07050 [Patescibacteria group bacterium]|nr:hypothetical protein [Patescibacteria group bacterium]